MNSFNLEQLCNHSGVASSTLRKILGEVPSLCPDGPWLAGGAIRRLLTGNKLDSDLDFFFRSASQADAFADGLLCKGFVRKGGVLADTYIKGDLVAQVVRIGYYDSAAALIDSFDFTICQFVFDAVHVHVGELALWDLGCNRLTPHKITYPKSSARRFLKYANQGFIVTQDAINAVLQSVIGEPALMQSESPYG